MHRYFGAATQRESILKPPANGVSPDFIRTGTDTVMDEMREW
jgi:hypothetical protein